VKRAVLFFSVVLSACDRSPSPVPPSVSAPVPSMSVSAPVAIVDAGAGTACGAMGCLQFDTVEDAFKAALASKPLVVAIGEAHAQKTKEGVASSAKRFTETILPAIKANASDLLLEIMMPAKLPDGGACVATATAVKKKQEVITNQQASTAQNEYVVMGDTAKKLGVIPDLLRPTCEDLAAIQKASDAEWLALQLGTIARLTKTKVGVLLDRNARTPADADKFIITYGGSLHNDVQPPPERADFCFGPDLIKRTGGRYVEIDLYVPDYIEDTDNWKKQEWYASYDKAKLGAKTTMFRPRENSFVILFPLK
jgi:hypothetical protein